ncbi:hypothetical protein D7Z54_28700 [Salibacterium salarium]|uniref:Uncharacterized protein n=1 Tax=Salibacterium salarium TaxID=284579 RepID=A0A428MUW2_9BACI|nr:hypothetical protein [Salibacterium salarium]RSL29919.1 hypothetical protein D7Z54_28700 [Salibacterium salarium]
MHSYTYGKLVFWFCFLVASLLLSACNNQEVNNNYYLSLMGESEEWKLHGYEVEITQENFKMGNGTLNMKTKNEYATDYFHFHTHMVINEEDRTVHSGSVTGPGIDISEETTGTNEGTYLDKDGESITFNDITDIYMIVEWWDPNKHEKMEERIDLYSKSKRDQTVQK